MNFWEVLIRIIWKVLKKYYKEVEGETGEYDIIEIMLRMVSVGENS